MWILKHEDGQYLENVFAPDEHEFVCDFRDVPQRMAIRFGHRQAAKDARQVISDRLGIRFRIVRLKRRRYVRLTRAAAKALLAAVMGDRFETKDMDEAISAIDATLNGGNDGR